ncbi:ATP-dependent zinc protease family protein [Pelagimonas varians]|uniref:Retropepsin-like aspartic endopeptidase domain-containing protein n=1 Tax=Pelagimonas varians TaxID=696760 RepID=A0A238L597_9RHOB|nr:RimK/LysX family protein [Pelagimonas varians]PYG26397.1 hypothetical protein C8N36_12317 [Pelagimonas varians]SMX49991.1 hypothetical protein PEV8663_04437 [Pelagimonas varians]
MKKPKKLVIGWRETVSLPDLDLTGFQAKIDTGARTTALHATNIRKLEINGRLWVEFLPDHQVLEGSDLCAAPVLHKRCITNTSGTPEERFIITSHIHLGARQARIEISLTDRTDMIFPIIVGRTGLRQLRMIVDPVRSWLQSEKPHGLSERDLK